MSRLRYIQIDQVLLVHKAILDEGEGLTGVKDQGQIESILTHMQNDDYYPEFLDKITHLVFCMVKFHCFNDGNKRTALAMGTYFIGQNFSHNLAEKFLVEMENVVVEVAQNTIDKELLREIIAAIIAETDQDEELLFKIYKALSVK